ncbi:YheC/YheD family protein [Paenibacillus sp.]|uniref:YheC/YheD family protein n=1 Tax=Paenibacillus sp. TaxID=58172 RepID=UPI002D4B0E39|nr:YheC/YheD family protein [Paenibacillus sp.]HZG87162.1 YheC/YheD family protein [Paenibacillus sp.]
MPAIGLMTNKRELRSLGRFAPYAAEAERLGFAAAVLFEPGGVDLAAGRIDGFRYERGVWREGRWPLPDVAHDFGDYRAAGASRRAKAVRRSAALPFTGDGLGHKWLMHRKLLATPYAALVPETRLLRSPDEAIALLREHGAVVIKPKHGSRGAGIVRIARAEDGEPLYRWQETRGPVERLTAAALRERIGARWRPARSIVQRWMDIRSPNGGVYDIRALLQRNERGVWQLTAMAVRESEPGRIASNVSVGGAVREVRPFLAALYGEAEAERLEAECRTVSAALPAALEAAYGRRFAELGVDFAVERGAVRIIEVNAKPGKKIVRALSGERAYADALLLPIRYAKLLSDRGCRTQGS